MILGDLSICRLSPDLRSQAPLTSINQNHSSLRRFPIHAQTRSLLDSPMRQRILITITRLGWRSPQSLDSLPGEIKLQPSVQQ